MSPSPTSPQIPSPAHGPGWPPQEWPYPLRLVEVEAGQVSVVRAGPELEEESRSSEPTLVFLHGTPTWSFLYRHFLQSLSRNRRVVAWDHLGFGQSDRPSDWGYRPEDHARNMGRIMDALELDQVILVLHDFGGPIGLDWALDHPERVRGLVLFNTWMWSLEGTTAARMSRLLSGRLGRALYRRNFSPRFLLPMGFADRNRLDRSTHQAYMDAFPDPDSRSGLWALARALTESGAWYQANWERRSALGRIPALLLWGMKDPAFGSDALARWQEALPQAQAVPFPHAGHFVQEEAPQEALQAMEAWLQEHFPLDRLPSSGDLQPPPPRS